MLSRAANLVIEAHERGYRVADDGEVISPMGQTLKQCLDKEGYWTFNLKPSEGGCATRVYVHRLAAYQKFGGNLFTPKIEVRHLDNNKDNNTPGNLALGTRHDNIMDLPESVRVAVAKNAARRRRKLSQAQAVALREDRRKGASYAKLTAKYGITKGAVSYIVNGKTYRN